MLIITAFTSVWVDYYSQVLIDFSIDILPTPTPHQFICWLARLSFLKCKSDHVTSSWLKLPSVIYHGPKPGFLTRDPSIHTRALRESYVFWSYKENFAYVHFSRDSIHSFHQIFRRSVTETGQEPLIWRIKFKLSSLACKDPLHLPNLTSSHLPTEVPALMTDLEVPSALMPLCPCTCCFWTNPQVIYMASRWCSLDLHQCLTSEFTVIPLYSDLSFSTVA